MIDTKKSINLFVVYAPEDELLKEKLVEHLFRFLTRVILMQAKIGNNAKPSC